MQMRIMLSRATSIDYHLFPLCGYEGRLASPESYKKFNVLCIFHEHSAGLIRVAQT